VTILVGVPVFRIPDLVIRCLLSLVYTKSDVLVIDNAADLDVKMVLRDFPSVNVIKNQVNGYCNGAWNQILEYGLEKKYDIIGLGSSDAELLPGWCERLQERAENFHDEIWIPSLKGEEEVKYADSIAGYFSFLPRRAAKFVYPIPVSLRHWFGDQYMFEKLRRNGWKTAVLPSVKAIHQQSAVTCSTPEAYKVIEQDIIEWGRLGL
jgi:GT2 family glycosyltransferase